MLQAGIMLVAFMVMPFAVASIHGGMAGIVKPGCNQAPNCIADKVRTAEDTIFFFVSFSLFRSVLSLSFISYLTFIFFDFFYLW